MIEHLEDTSFQPALSFLSLRLFWGFTLCIAESRGGSHGLGGPVELNSHPPLPQNHPLHIHLQERWNSWPFKWVLLNALAL